MVTGYIVSVIDHGEIVREDLSGRSVLAAASCNATGGLQGFSLKSQVNRIIAQAHVQNPF